MDTELISEDELDYRLGRSNPVSRPALDDESVRVALVSVRRIVESRPQREAPSQLAWRPVPARRWVTLGAATAAVAVASLVGVETLTGGSGGVGLPLAVPPAAAAQLNGVAHAAATQPTPAAGQWEYLEVRIEGTATMQAGNPTDQGTNPAGYPTVAYTDTQTLQNWTAADGDTRQRDTGDGFSFLTPQDEATYLAHKAVFDAAPDQLGRLMVIGVSEDKMFAGEGGPQPIWETSPPSDPQTLINELWSQFFTAAKRTLPAGLSQQQVAHAAKNLVAQRPSILWTDLSDLLLNSTSAQLRSTAYAALTYVPDTKVVGNETDQLGRPGIAISWTGHGPGDDETLIVSPSTGDLLEADDTFTKAADGLPAGTVARREIYLQRAIVDSDTALPGGGTQPIAPPTQTTTTPAQTTTTPAAQTVTTVSQG